MLRFVALFSGLLLASCTPSEAPEPAADTFYGGKHLLQPPQYRSVGITSSGPSSSGMSASSQVWEVSRRWDDVTPEDGIAWPANSGLSWDEKYAAWVDLLDTTPSDDGHATVELLTPQGRTLPSPRLECAEVAMFLRASFAAWYGLPFYLEAWSPTYGEMFFGHFGIVDATGARISGYPRFATAYTDHTSAMAGMSDAQIIANWPHDSTLRSKYLTTAKDDHNDFLGPDLYAGAYFDEVHLNKRVGHFLLRLLTNFGSMHLASGTNTYNLAPDAMREGDLLLHRWQSSGIGHAMVIKEVEPLPGGHLDAEIIYGSMPRIQPVWYSANISKSYFTDDAAGSGETDANGTRYSALGGGLKRWRTPILQSGRWVNVVATVDQSDWIGSTDYVALEDRISQLDALLGTPSPADQRDTALARIQMARDNLALHPSSCANRSRREQAFDDLYAVMTTHFGMTRTQVDRQYRIVDDYVFAELEYADSKTCCWNSTTADMYDLIVAHALEEAEQAALAGQCADLTVFKARNGGSYDPFRAYAYSVGRGSEWVEWSEDESCPQRGVSEDLEAAPPYTDFCSIRDDIVQLSCMRDWYADADGDGFGAASVTKESCSQPAGYLPTHGDCDDTRATTSPGATETCNQLDDDCDGTVDEGCSTGGTGNTGGTGSTGGTGPSPGCGCSRMSPQSAAPFLGLAFVFLGRRRDDFGEHRQRA